MSTYTNYSKLEVDGTISSSVQGELIGTFTTMPTASALNEGKTIYYTGATSGNYVQNTFYTCVNNSGTYTWTSASPKQVSVDSALSETSTNPVQNKVIANALKGYAKKEDISTVYKAKGSIASANLPASPSVGDVYDLTDASSYGPVGTNVVWTGTKWDALAGITDISGKQDKLTAGTGISLGSNNTISLATSGVTAGSKGSSTQVPVITVDAYGRVTSISTSTIYPPTSAGTSGQIWVSDGSGQGVWQSKDTTPTSGSTNAITSGAVYSELAKKQNNLTFDSAPTSASNNPVTSGGVYTALQAKQNNLTFDSTPTSGSSNPVTSGGVYSAINGKQDKLTFDSTPTSGSNNPVTSGGIFTAINSVSSAVAGKQDKLTFDSTPTSGSSNPVTSGGIYNALKSSQSKQPIIRFTNYDGTIPVESGCSYSTDGNSWVNVTEDSQIAKPFTGWVKFNNTVSGSGYTSRSETIYPKQSVVTPLSRARINPATFSLGNKGYVCGGAPHAGVTPSSYPTSVDVYDENGNRTSGQDMSIARAGATSFVLNNKAFVCGGKTAYTDYYGQSSVDVYDENGNRTSGQDMSEKRTHMCSFILGNKGYVHGNSMFLTSTIADVYDTNGNRTSIDGLTTPSQGDVVHAFAIGNVAYIFSDDSANMIDVYGNISTPSNITLRQYCAIFVLDGKTFVCGGYKWGSSSTINYNTVEIFDSNGNKTLGTTLSTGRYYCVGIELNNIGLVCGGMRKTSSSGTATYYDTVDVYDKNGNRTTGEALSVARYNAKAVKVGSHVFICGGQKDKSTTSESDYRGISDVVERYGEVYDYEYTFKIPVTEFTDYFLNGVEAIGTANEVKTYSKSVTEVTSVYNYTWEYTFKYENGDISN